jgi:hypothetical protein|tara:strand:+ start:122 stop:607 length:486 start_codon:yes stop_codon:yes gene_type:complete
MSLDLTKQRISSAKGRVDRFIDQNIMLWATEEVLLPGQTNIARSVNEQASKGLSLEKSGFMKVDLTWEYIKDGKPVHLYLEYGTRPHTITPKGKEQGGADVLHWKGLSGGFVIGEDHYASLVRHPGTQPKKLVEGIKDERQPKLTERIIREVHNYLEVEAV